VEDDYRGPKLHLGSGTIHWDGWLNVDQNEKSDVQWDLRKLELPNDHADIAVAIHVLEHFYAWEAEDLLTEWKRVLKPGGKLVLELPCLDKVLQYVAKCVSEKLPMMEWATMHVFWGDPKYKSVPMCHKWGYTMTSLTELLLTVGFKDPMFENPRYHFPIRDMRVTAFKE
jgi:predicted SAM-dependent methyltransferase